MEPSIRSLVADHLGVGEEELVPDVSLRDDLAADSLDLVTLSMALEAEFAIVVPERILDRVHTYGDLVQAIDVLIRSHCEAEAVEGAVRAGRGTRLEVTVATAEPVDSAAERVDERRRIAAAGARAAD